MSDTPDFFFAFPDGALHYDCTQCNALCCRGGGFGGFLEREMEDLYGLYPCLAQVTTSLNAGHVYVSNPVGRCFFLREDRACEIHASHGPERKPGVCLAFPFNSFMRLADSIVVTPNFLCPLKVLVPPEPGRAESTHAVLESSLPESGMLGRCDEPVLWPGEAESAVLETERAFRDLCGARLGAAGFMHTLNESAGAAAPFEGFMAWVAKLMGWCSAGEVDPQWDGILHTLAPVLRARMLRLPVDARARMLVLTSMLTTAASRLGASPSAGGLYSLWQSVRPALYLLALDSHPMGWSSDEKLELPRFGDAESTLASALLRRLSDGKRPAREVLEAAIDKRMPPWKRMALLVQTGSILLARP